MENITKRDVFRLFPLELKCHGSLSSGMPKVTNRIFFFGSLATALTVHLLSLLPLPRSAAVPWGSTVLVMQLLLFSAIVVHVFPRNMPGSCISGKTRIDRCVRSEDCKIPGCRHDDLIGALLCDYISKQTIQYYTSTSCTRYQGTWYNWYW